MFDRKRLLKKKIFSVPVLIFVINLLSCHPDFRGGPCHPEWVVDGVKDIVVSPLENGLSLITLYVENEGMETYYSTGKAEINYYRVNSTSQLHIEKNYPLFVSTFAQEYNFFDFLDIYPVEGTGNTFLFKAMFFKGWHSPGKNLYFLNENGTFRKIMSGVFNTGFKIDRGYYFSSVSLFYWAPFYRYSTSWEKYEWTYKDYEISQDRLPGIFEVYPYDSGYHPRIFLRDKGLELSRLFIVEGGGVISGTSKMYFQGSDSFDYKEVENDPEYLKNIASYLFIGDIVVGDYSMDVTDVRYIQFKDPATFVTILGADYFKDIGFVVYAREFPRDLDYEVWGGLSGVKDRVMILDPLNLSLIMGKEIMYDGKVIFHAPLMLYPDSGPIHPVAFDRKNKRIISVFGNKVTIINLGSFKIVTLTLPSPWVCDAESSGVIIDSGGNIGVWVDGDGYIWIVARDMNSGKVEKEEIVKPCIHLRHVRFRYGVLRIEEKNGNYSIKVVGELK